MLGAHERGEFGGRARERLAAVEHETLDQLRALECGHRLRIELRDDALRRATRPLQLTASNPGKPCSATVATAGSAASRRGDDTETGRSWPPVMLNAESVNARKMHISPPPLPQPTSVVRGFW